ncbi:PLC-like phosphodiesterase [Glarea lozoyensis ATCC 20868]|uniref:PLC-like phosphodiesterase n=1 Tax=Glarea lozoyensis (strain ATCC 20868 / MF5171) TaxID=1116229 RepID=S3D3L4_GLAL2|nr:PLC-like phosphodiesterase [Glarea lozoyensis ATCC 20868]EPE31729.1 PLC-like phosphodiesterase [Glarea lozoyensis ATCC 20868]
MYFNFAATAALLSHAHLAQALPQIGSSISSSSVASTSAVSARATVWSVSEAAVPTSTAACNNSPDLCDRHYNNITHMGAHDVAFLRDSSTSFSTSGNTFYNATVALSAGIRLLQAQVHLEAGVLRLCHTSCLLLDGGTLEAWLATIKTWMDANRNEVVTVILVNADDQKSASFGKVFTSSGLSTYGYTLPTTSSMLIWPTLQSLISANTRLVTFIASIDYDPAFPYLLPEFNYIFETAFGVMSPTGFGCDLDRPSTQSSAAAAVSAGFMGMINHFLDKDAGFGIIIPDVDNITSTNSPSTTNVGALGKQGAECYIKWGVKPTFILVDFFNVGPAIETADMLNGIVGTGRVVVSTEPLTLATNSASRFNGYSGLTVVAIAMAVVAIVNTVWL